MVKRKVIADGIRPEDRVFYDYSGLGGCYYCHQMWASPAMRVYERMIWDRWTNA